MLKAIRPTRAVEWFASKGWSPFPFQRECWAAYMRGEHTLLHSSTGTGKTLAAWFGPVLQYLSESGSKEASAPRTRPSSPPLTVLWITPLRALSADTEETLRGTIDDLGIPWTLERRTGDSSARTKAAIRKRLPTALITTSESLTLLLSYADLQEQFQSLRCIVVDEWHELLGSKRGTQTELALGRLSSLAPQAVRCALSATIGNLDDALSVLVGCQSNRPSRLVHGKSKKKISIRSILPQSVERFPWAGHLGMTMAPRVVAAIEPAKSTLVFTNTRNQTEQWYQELLRLRPDWAGCLALHHGSLDGSVRKWVEEALREGKLKAVVCTSSLDLGVDFSEVDQVIQIGSPKGAARLLQRAGRSGHQPDAVSNLRFVPTNTFELIELAAAKRIAASVAKGGNGLEHRTALSAPLDCLVQHLVTRAMGEPFDRETVKRELACVTGYQSLSDEDLEWACKFVVSGGDSLQAYEEFRRVQETNGMFSVVDPRVARLHRMAIGTIASEIAMLVQYATGQTLGTVEEGFIAKLKPGDRFQFAGKTLELIQVREGTAVVKRSKLLPTTTPRWGGGRMPLSTQMASEVRDLLDEAASGRYAEEEMKAIRPVLELQERWSVVPKKTELLVESLEWKNSWSLTLYPFEGRMVHEGLASLVAYRISRRVEVTMSMTVNDYGLMIQSNQPLGEDAAFWKELLTQQQLEEDLLASLNATELCKRQFREIARIAGLIHPGYPGQVKRGKHLQASSNMFFDAFVQYDPSSRLLQQARDEVMRSQLEIERIRKTLSRLELADWRWQLLQRPTPLSFPLIVEQLRQRMSSESLESRVRKLQQQLETELTKEECGRNESGRSGQKK
ncbi:ligase-associated DNA damage response DEXH box helicase [Pirellulaceae bacterium SH467]